MRICLAVFDMTGYFAHFRKYFSTTSSLSYSFPPRTTIVGMVAGILGYDRDSYYELFSTSKCKVALQILRPARRTAYKMNYLMTDKPLSIDKLRGIGPSAQVYTEILLSENPELSRIHYRVFFNHEDEIIQKKLSERIANKKFCYPPSFGMVNFIADLEYVNTVDAITFRSEKELDIRTVIPTSIVRCLNPQKGTRMYIEELVPADFSSDRLLLRKEKYIYESFGNAIRVSVDCETFRCHVSGEEIIGVFM